MLIFKKIRRCGLTFSDAQQCYLYVHAILDLAMPFTFAHPAIVLPFAKLSKRWISITGLIVGSMMPDFEYFLRMKVKSVYSHTWSGLFWFDVPLGLIVLVIFQFLVKDNLIEHLPTSLYTRFVGFKGTDRSFLSIRNLLIVIVSIFLGALSHIFWDGFTHPSGYFVLLIPNLSYNFIFAGHSIIAYKIIQHVSTVIGLIVILATIFSLRVVKERKSSPTLFYWVIVGFVIFITLLVRHFTGLKIHQYGDVIVSAIAGAFLGLITISLILQLKIKNRL